MAQPVQKKTYTQQSAILSEDDQKKQDLQVEAPTEVRLSKAKILLTLTWSDGVEKSISANDLRDNCKSAQSERLRLMDLAVPAPDGLTISQLKPIGSYGLNIVFSDGFDRGIYPWGYLQRIATAS